MSADDDAVQLRTVERRGLYAEMFGRSEAVLGGLTKQMTEAQRTEFDRRLAVAFSLAESTGGESEENAARATDEKRVFAWLIALGVASGVNALFFKSSLGFVILGFLTVLMIVELGAEKVIRHLEKIESRRLIQQWRSIGVTDWMIRKDFVKYYAGSDLHDFVEESHEKWEREVHHCRVHFEMKKAIAWSMGVYVPYPADIDSFNPPPDWDSLIRRGKEIFKQG